MDKSFSINTKYPVVGRVRVHQGPPRPHDQLLEQMMMDQPEFKHFKVTPASPTIGGTIEGIHLSEISDSMAAELRTALWHYGVLFARDQHLTPEQQKKFNLAKAGFMEMIDLAKKYDLKIALGSDLFLSKEMYDLHPQEWNARAKLFSNLEIMRQATSIGAELLAFSGERNRFKEGPLGVIQVGAYADLVLVDGNPLEDISLLAEPETNLKLIVKDGVVYKNTLVK
jgi:imidazolonepropionase-like amidohydrolase